MEREKIIQALWKAVSEQGAESMECFFTEDAVVLWPNTNERFTVQGYIRSNCEYPGQWSVQIEQISPDGRVSVARVWNEANEVFRAVSFYQWQGERICRMEEYWGDVAPAPVWRQKMKTGAALEAGDAILPSAIPVGKCGFFCGVCPGWTAGECAGCQDAHVPGDCFTRDCTGLRGLSFCTLCEKFPCGELLARKKATVLDKDWLRWKRRE